MSVLDYKHKFNELMRYAPEVVPIEVDKCQKFLECLWPDVISAVTASTYPAMGKLS